MAELPYTLDRRLRCPHCNHYPLRRPLVWNATSRQDGSYICSWCADVELELALQTYLERQEVADA